MDIYYESEKIGDSQVHMKEVLKMLEEMNRNQEPNKYEDNAYRPKNK